MSKAEILEELLKLTPEERDEIRRILDEADDDSLTVDELARMDARIAEQEAYPQSAIPWEEFKSDLAKKYGL